MSSHVRPSSLTIQLRYIDTVIEFLRLFLTNYVKRTLSSAELPHTGELSLSAHVAKVYLTVGLELLALLGAFILALDDPDLFGHATSVRRVLHSFLTALTLLPLRQFSTSLLSLWRTISISLKSGVSSTQKRLLYQRT
jgi:hypothetical protein